MADQFRAGFARHAPFVAGLGRAFAGALLFALPMLMTMELWFLGIEMDALRLALLCLLAFFLLVRMSRLGGLRDTESFADDVADALVTIAVAAPAAALLLWLFGAIRPDDPARVLVGQIALQTVPCAIGAMLARNQLGGDAANDPAKTEQNYWDELFLMLVGALFLSLNIAPTEEVVLIAHQMTVWREIGLLLLSLVLMHNLVYWLDFQGTEERAPHEGFWNVLSRFTLVGYAIVLTLSLYLLWSFGRTDGQTFEESLSAAVVLALPGAFGAAAARLIL